MSAARFYIDEDIYGAIPIALRRAGIDAISTVEASRLSEPDEDQLAWAAGEGRAFVTFNVAHFVALHTEWLKQGRHHAGILVSSQRPIGELLQRLIHLANQLDSEDLIDRLEFLSDW